MKNKETRKVKEMTYWVDNNLNGWVITKESADKVTTHRAEVVINTYPDTKYEITGAGYTWTKEFWMSKVRPHFKTGKPSIFKMNVLTNL